MSEKSEPDLWKQKRLLEMRRLLLEKKLPKKEQIEKETEDPVKIMNKLFVGRAWEVFRAAEHQYPKIASKVKEAFIQIHKNGNFKGPITGEQLLWFFRKIGLNIRLETKIRIFESGELKTLAQKLKESE